MRYLVVIPARGGSKSIPGKNIVAVAGKPLIAWTIEAARGCAEIEKIVVSTDSEEIATVAKANGADVIMRPLSLSQDDSPTRPVIEHAFEHYKSLGIVVDAVITLQPTSPLRKPVHVREAIELFEKNPSADSLVSVTRVPHHMEPSSLMQIEGDWGTPSSDNPILRRQDKAEHWCRNGAAIYITRASKLRDYVWGGKTLVYPMDKISSIDIDDDQDLQIAHALLNSSF